MSPTAYFLAFSFSAVSWIVLLSGVSSVQYWCSGSCRALLGLPWWLTWFQLAVFCGVLVNFRFNRSETSRGLRAILLCMLSITALLAMWVADRMLNSQVIYSLSDARVNTAAAGAIMVAIFNLILVILLGLEESDSGKSFRMSSHQNPTADQGISSPPLPPMPASRPAANV